MTHLLANHERQTGDTPGNSLELHKNLEFRLGYLCFRRQEAADSGESQGYRHFYRL